MAEIGIKSMRACKAPRIGTLWKTSERNAVADNAEFAGGLLHSMKKGGQRWF